MVNPLALQQPVAEVYLDANATTPVLPQIAEAVSHTMQTIYGNPSSSHITGLKARYILDHTRRLGRQLIGAQRGQFIFTSGATEGIQTAVLSALSAYKTAPQLVHSDGTAAKPVVLYGATEHKAVPQSLQHWLQVLSIDAELLAIPVDGDGLLDQNFIEQQLPRCIMICTMAVNNETGVYQDLLGLDKLIRSRNPNTLWMVDCVQALGKIDIQLDQLSIDYAPFSGHKLYAPKGIGFFYVREGAPYTPLIIGGGQESGLRSGTENLPGIAALHTLFELLLDDSGASPFQSHDVLCDYREQLAAALRDSFPTLTFNHDFSRSVPTTLNFSVKGILSRDIMDVFDASNIRVSSGSACSSKVTRSFVLDAMQRPTWCSEGAVRLSFGPAMSQAEISHACERIRQAGDALKQACVIVSDSQTDSADSQLDGVVQLKFDQHCCYLLIDQCSRQVIVIDPIAALSERICNIVRCRHYQVQGVVSSDAEFAHADGSLELLNRLFLPEQEVDAWGWPSNAAQTELGIIDSGETALAQLTVGARRLLRVGSRQPLYLLTNAENDAIDFSFIGRHREAEPLVGLVASNTLLCPSDDEQNQLFFNLCELQSDCQPEVFHVDVPIGTDLAWLTDPQLLILDVREQQEHLMQPIDAAGEVKNVPLTRLAQFVQQADASTRQRPLVCVCRSGNRSRLAAAALVRQGFSRVQQLQGGIGFWLAGQQRSA